jgi:hypothetical protein
VSDAIVAFHRAIRAHRRLMKLAPDQYDYGRVKFLAAERARAVEKRASWLVALEKVYGPEARQGVPDDWLLPKPKTLSVRTQRAVERELAAWELWLSIGHEALSRAQKVHAASNMSLNTLCSLIETAMTLGRLATGRETNWSPPNEERQNERSFEEALQMIYGPDEAPPPSATITTPQSGATLVQKGELGRE